MKKITTKVQCGVRYYDKTYDFVNVHEVGDAKYPVMAAILRWWRSVRWWVRFPYRWEGTVICLVFLILIALAL